MKAKTKGMMSFGEIRELVCNAICTREGADFNCYIVDIFTDSVVYESCGKDNVCKYYQCSYSIVDSTVTLGEATEVEKQVEYVPLKAACTVMAAAAGDTTGYRWRVRVVEFGVDKNGNYWDKDALTAALAKFEGAKVFALAEAQHQAQTHPFGKSVRDLIGVLQGATIEMDGIYATLIILPAAQWLRDNLVGCAAQGLDNVIGLSVDITGKRSTKEISGKKHPYLAVIASVTVDVVYDPAAGGEFIKMAAAVKKASQKEDEMFQKLLAALLAKRPDLHGQITAAIAAGTMTEEEALTKIAAATVKEAGGDENNEQLVATVVTRLTAAFSAQTENETVKEMKLLACGMKLDSLLASSGLPDASQKHLRTQFDKRVFEEAELQAAIKGMKEMVDSLTASGSIQGAGDIRVGRESGERLQAAFDGMLGVPLADTMRDVPIFTSLRAAYVEMTGDTDVTGVLSPQQQRRMQAAYGDSTFAYALGTALYRRLVADYREMTDYGVSRIVGNNIRNATDFRPLEAIRVGYYGDIPTVDTDTADYPDLGEVSDEKIEYALAERGGIITINRRTIINDDLRLILKIVSRFPRAARRTVAKRVWNPFITNATYKGDNKAIFHSDHGNLGSAAYSITTAEAAKTAMFNQTEPGSGEKIGLVPVTVSFPSALRALVTNVNNFNPQAVAVESGNSMFQFFQAAGLFQNPFMADVNDWLMFGDPNECEIVEIAYLNGQQEPQMLVADNPAVGQMFVGGRIQYRISHDFEAEVIDYRNAYKAVVAG